MAVTSRTLVGGGDNKVLVLLVTISGADETGTVIYDNSAFVNNPGKGSLAKYSISGSDSLVSLAWDQTTDSPIVSVNPVNSPKMDFKKFGINGIANPNGTGATGDIVVTTVGIGAGDVVSIILWIDQN